MCVGVCERERETDREGEGEGESLSVSNPEVREISSHAFFFVPTAITNTPDPKVHIQNLSYFVLKMSSMSTPRFCCLCGPMKHCGVFTLIIVSTCVHHDTLMIYWTLGPCQSLHVLVH